MATTTTPAAGTDAIGDATTIDAGATDRSERPIGARVRRKEDPRFLTGRGLYTDDVRLLGTVHAAFVRSPRQTQMLLAERRPSIEVVVGEFVKQREVHPDMQPSG